jgi:ribose 5-phosphate isomerase
MIPGVVENGLFIGITNTVFVGYKSGVKKLEKKLKNC